MQIYRSFVRTLALSGAVLAVTLGGARAWEADQVAASLKSAFDGQGLSIDWSSAEKDGSSILLSDVKIGEEDEKAEIGDVTLEDVTEDEDSYTVGHVAVPDYTAAGDDGTVQVSGVSFTGLDLPKSSEQAGMPHYRTADIDSVVVTDKEDKQLFSLTGMHAEIQPPPDDGTLAFTGAVEGFTADLAAMADEDDQRAKLEKLGYSQVNGNATMAGSWNPSDGHLKLSAYRLTVDDAGTFGATADISGYTPDFIKSLREMGEQMKAGDGGDDTKQAAKGLAMLGLLQQLTFGGLSLRFEDDGLTDKALQMAAERQGTEPEQIANQIKGVIPLKLTEYLGADLTQEITQAVGTFLDDPQNIELRAEPASPLPFAILMGAAMGAPQSLVQMLGLKVTANQ